LPNSVLSATETSDCRHEQPARLLVQPALLLALQLISVGFHEQPDCALQPARLPLNELLHWVPGVRKQPRKPQLY